MSQGGGSVTGRCECHREVGVSQGGVSVTGRCECHREV